MEIISTNFYSPKQKYNSNFKGNTKSHSAVDTEPNKDTLSLTTKKQNTTKKIMIATVATAATAATAILLGVKNKVNIFKNVDIIKETLNAVKDCEGLVFQNPNLNLIKKKYNAKNLYDLSIRYATIGNNTKHLTGRALIKNEIPEMFKGMDETTLLSELDKLPTRLHSAVVENYPEKSGTISINGKIFKFTWLGQGGSNNAYKLTDDKGHNICFKHANRLPTRLGLNNGIIEEVAILNEANKAGVVDVPKLYMANIFGKNTGQYKPPEGTWQLVEFIDKPRTVNSQSLKLKKWLDKIGLIHNDIDDNSNNLVNGVVIDMGMIVPKDNKANINCEVSEKVLQGFYEGKTTTEILQMYN